MMKKKTKQIIMSLFILIIFALSSFAFVGTGFHGGAQDSQDVQPLAHLVVTGPIDPRVEQAYFQSGFTFLKVYYHDNDSRLFSQFDGLVSQLSTNTGQPQLIVQKLATTQDEHIEVFNLNVQRTLNQTDENRVLTTLCMSLLAPPVECALVLQSQNQNNASIDTNVSA